MTCTTAGASPTLCSPASGWRRRIRDFSTTRCGASEKSPRATGAADDAGFRERLAAIEIETVAFAATFAHAAEIANAQRPLEHDSSILKIAGTELLQRIADLLLDAAGGEAAHSIETEDGPVEVAPLFLQVRRATIYGGSSEIQRNIVAKRILALPV